MTTPSTPGQFPSWITSLAIEAAKTAEMNAIATPAALPAALESPRVGYGRATFAGYHSSLAATSGLASTSECHRSLPGQVTGSRTGRLYPAADASCHSSRTG